MDERSIYYKSCISKEIKYSLLILPAYKHNILVENSVNK
jgi:hypothetical protein